MQSGAINMNPLTCYIQFSPSDACRLPCPPVWILSGIIGEICSKWQAGLTFGVTAQFRLIDLLVRSGILTVRVTPPHDKTPNNLADRYRGQDSSDWHCPWRLCFEFILYKTIVYIIIWHNISVTAKIQLYMILMCVGACEVRITNVINYQGVRYWSHDMK